MGVCWVGGFWGIVEVWCRWMRLGQLKCRMWHDKRGWVMWGSFCGTCGVEGFGHLLLFVVLAGFTENHTAGYFEIELLGKCRSLLLNCHVPVTIAHILLIPFVLLSFICKRW
jgi:hypothetical protein